MQDWRDVPDVVAERRFELKNDKSYRFWTIAMDGQIVTVRYGQIGNHGTRQEVAHDDVQQAKRYYVRRIRERTRRGYSEVKKVARKQITSEDFRQSRRDHDPFLQAILDDPDDVGSYLIYADWLAERDDPLGEFIQTQIQLEDPRLEMWEKSRLESRESDLYSGNLRAWLGDLQPLSTEILPYKFIRGLLGSITLGVPQVDVCEKVADSWHADVLREIFLWDKDAPYDNGTLTKCLAILERGRYTNMRNLEIGDRPGYFSQVSYSPRSPMPLGDITSLLQQMPRLESLKLDTIACDYRRLSALPLPRLSAFTLISERLQNILPHVLNAGWLTQLTILNLRSGPEAELRDEHIEELSRLGLLEKLLLLTLPEEHLLSEAMQDRLEHAPVTCVYE